MPTDSGIVTIYDLENDGAPLTCHLIDAREFLRFPRWSATPKDSALIKVVQEGDTGEAMRLKEMSFKSLQAMANKAGMGAREIRKMDKAALVEALLKK